MAIFTLSWGLRRNQRLGQVKAGCQWDAGPESSWKIMELGAGGSQVLRAGQ